MSTVNSIDLGALSKQYAARDLPGHQKLKYRETGQNAPDEVRKDRKELRRELEERERIGAGKEKESSKRLSITDKESEKSKKQKVEAVVNLDADEVLPDSDDEKSENGNDERDEDEEENDEDEDDDNDAEALLAELNKIKKERAAEAAKQEAERKAREEKIRVENILKGNPLLSASNKPESSSSSDFKVKRRWDDDVVFKNCAKLEDTSKKGFINDTLRSDFHKKFMERYIK